MGTNEFPVLDYATKPSFPLLGSSEDGTTEGTTVVLVDTQTLASQVYTQTDVENCKVSVVSSRPVTKADLPRTPPPQPRAEPGGCMFTGTLVDEEGHA
eukprot:m.330376 g.330376  ORF g.330376 m.330376 type:complete len:98 (-) comp19762_c0_seq1:65-358(-)